MPNSDIRRSAVIWLASGIGWFVLEAVAASAFPHYDYAHFYISDLGNPTPEFFEHRTIDSRLAWVMNLDLVAHGLALFIGSIFALRAQKFGFARYAFVALVALNAAGGSVVAAIHSSNRSIANGTEPLHALAALISILAGNLAIVIAGLGVRNIAASPAYRGASVALGCVGIASLGILVHGTPSWAPGDGLWERGSVYTIMLWEIMTAVVILRAYDGGSGATSTETAM